MSKPIDAVLVGAGQRGRDAIGIYAQREPGELRFVAVAEPDEDRRKLFAKQHGIPPEMQFRTWEEVMERPQLAPLLFNLTQDRMHRESAVAALEKGYHLFLEKPMAHTPEGCLEIAAAARAHRRMVQICHPLRYTPFYRRVKELISTGKIGRLLSISMYENVGYWHFAHSYVRGNWRRMDESGPVILTKCCHDMDIATWMADDHVREVSSFGRLAHFREENAPEGAPPRCTDGCPVEETCPYYAPAFYLGPGVGWPTSAVSVHHGLEERRRALETGPYGRCVYRSDNDAVDHQVLNAEFEKGTTFNFAVRAHSADCYRTIRAIGEHGEIDGHFEKREVKLTRFGQGYSDKATRELFKTEVWDGGHGGGDTGVVRNFLRAIQEEDYEGLEHSLDLAVEGHLLSFAAEQARVKREVVQMEEFRSAISSAAAG